MPRTEPEIQPQRQLDLTAGSEADGLGHGRGGLAEGSAGHRLCIWLAGLEFGSRRAERVV